MIIEVIQDAFNAIMIVILLISLGTIIVFGVPIVIEKSIDCVLRGLEWFRRKKK